MVSNYAILNGALELLPESLATLAIAPLQMKMVIASARVTVTNWGAAPFSAIELRSRFGSLTEQARSLHSRYAGEIQQKSGSVNVSQLLPLIRGQ